MSCAIDSLEQRDISDSYRYALSTFEFNYVALNMYKTQYT